MPLIYTSICRNKTASHYKVEGYVGLFFAEVLKFHYDGVLFFLQIASVSDLMASPPNASEPVLPIFGNTRPIQPLNSRSVMRSFAVSVTEL